MGTTSQERIAAAGRRPRRHPPAPLARSILSHTTLPSCMHTPSSLSLHTRLDSPFPSPTGRPPARAALSVGILVLRGGVAAEKKQNREVILALGGDPDAKNKNAD